MYCHTLHHVIIPDTVTAMEDYAFYQTSEFRIRIRGAEFDITQTESKYSAYYNHILNPVEDYDKTFLIHVVFSLLVDGKFDGYSDTMPDSLKLELLLDVLEKKPESKIFLETLETNAFKIFVHLLNSSEENKIQVIRKMIAVNFITKQNIDEYILAANENQGYEVQVMLMNYKDKHIGYDDIQDKFQL
mgnify:CR=1 FL=1